MLVTNGVWLGEMIVSGESTIFLQLQTSLACATEKEAQDA
jgi:hypothetical protein